MTCEEMKSLWGDYLLGDVSPEQKNRLEEHLQTCKACQADFQEFKETLKVLGHWPDVDPAQKWVFVPALATQSPTIREKWWSFWENWRQPVRWAAAFGVVILLILGISKTELSYKNGRFQFAFGQPVSEGKITEPNWEPILDRYQAKTAAVVSQLIQASEARQQKNLLLVVDRLNQQWYRQRQNDLSLIATGFQALKAESENRAMETSRLVQWLGQRQETANPIHSQKN
ncbi:MAG: hypothetical protein GXO76_13035 [Calditrichaeota bacterium]|nr:hypothetical protein [Calditrichota bacterium]